MSIYRYFELLKYYLNKNNNGVTPTNDKYKIYDKTNKIMESKSVDTFDVNYEPILEI